MVNFQGGHTPHPEIDTSIRRRDDYPQSLWNHPEPNPSETVNLGDEGLSNGDVIDPYLDAYLAPDRRIEIPEGEYVYQRDGHFAAYPDMHLVGLGGMGDVVFDQGGQSGREDIDLHDPGVCVIENITVEGYADYRHDYGISAQHPDAELIMKRFRVQDGVDPSIGGRGAGFYLKSIRPESPYNDGLYDGHSGCLRLLWCRMTRSPDNNNYVDGPIVNSDADGQVIVVGGEQRYGNISILRIGHHGATVYGTRITAANSTSEVPGTNEYYQQRGIWVRQPNHSGYGDYSEHTPSNTVIDECEFFYPSGAGGGGIFVLGASDAHGSGVITRCRVENNSDVQLLNYASGNVEVYDSHAYGSGDLNSDLTWQGSSEIGSSADPIDTDPWWGLDLADVTPPRNLSVTTAEEDSITVDWEPPSTAVFGVQQYNIYVDGTQDQSVSGSTTTATVSGLDADTQYEIGVTAVDNQGNESGRVSISATTDDVITGEVPIGGGAGYPYTLSADDADVVASSRTSLESALGSASVGDVVFLDGDASISALPTDPIVVPSGVTLASDRGVDGADGGLIYTDQASTDWDSIVQAQAGSRVTGLRVRGPLDTNTQWITYSADLDFGGIEAIGTDVEVDNCEVFAVAGGILDGLDSFEAHHNYVHHCHLRDEGVGIFNNGANSPFPVYDHNLFEHCRRSIDDDGAGGYIARHNIVQGPTLTAPINQGPGGGTTTTVANNTVEVVTHDETGAQLPAVEIEDVPSDQAEVNSNHLHNPDAPNDDPSPGEEDHAIVQIDSSTGDHVDTWNAVTFENNHYGTTEPPSGVGAIPIGDPNTIGRPQNLSITSTDLTEIDISWAEPQNTGSGVQSYTVYVNGGRYATYGAATTSTTVSSLEPDTDYLIEVTAADEDDVESFPASINGTTDPFEISRPQNVTVSDITYNAATISWDEPENVGAGIDRYRTLIDDVPEHEGLPPETREATFDGLEPETQYRLAVQAYDTEGFRSQAAIVTVTTNSPPSQAPTAPGFTVLDMASTRAAFEIEEPDNPGSAPISHYRLFIDGEFDHNVSAATSIHTVQQLEPDTRYEFALSAVNADDIESPRTSLTARTLESGANHGGTPIGPDDPSCGFGDLLAEISSAVPENLTVTNSTSSSVSVSWDEPSENAGLVDHYAVYLDGSFEVDVSVTEATLTGLSAGTEYDVTVTAVDGDGNESNPATVTASTNASS